MKLYFDDESFDGQLQRSVGKADSGMANVGECLAIAGQITPGDRDSWYRAWFDFAARLVEPGRRGGQGRAPGQRPRRLPAGGGVLPAGLLLPPRRPGRGRAQSAYASSVLAFRSALGHLDPGRVLSGAVPGYLFTPGPGRWPASVILHIGGYDGTAEELYASVPAALDRGYAFAALDGPGQGAMLYDQRIPMRPDWENVVPAMFDAMAAHPEVDPGRVVLVGRSFGGLIAPRGRPGEHRLAAMIVDPGQFDLGAAVTARLGPLMEQVHDPSGRRAVRLAARIPAVKALLTPRMATHGVTTVRAFCADMLRYTNAETVDRVSCPSFVTDNETDVVSTGQGKILFDHLTCPKEFRLFTKAEGAEGHCEGMAPIVFWDAAFDWLDSAVLS